MARNYRRVAGRKARKYGINPRYFKRQINQESGFRTGLSSPAGAQGIAQIMPATARAWGVNPNRPVQALDAAAKNMARYLRSYGGDWRKALAAYNAGPGAVAQYGGVPPYAETQHYVQTILRGGNPKQGKSSPRGKGGRKGIPGRAAIERRQAPAAGSLAIVDMLREQMAQRPAPRSSGLPESPLSARRALKVAGAGAPLQSSVAPDPGPSIDDILATLSQEAAQRPGVQRSDIPGIRGRQGGKGKGRGGVKGFGGSKGDLLEMFWQGPGGLNIDEGARRPQGFVSGHDTHLHAAGRTRRETLSIARRAKKMGLVVRELEPFDKVDPVHTTGSHHYRRSGAADISGDAAKLARLARLIARAYGY